MQPLRARRLGALRASCAPSTSGHSNARLAPGTGDVGASFSVTPVVVIWGAVRHEMPDSAMREGVEFVPGEKLGAWLTARNDQPVDKAVANDLLERLAAFRDR